MAKTNDIKKLQADLKDNPELAQKINHSILDILIVQLNVLGYNITLGDLEEAVEVKGASALGGSVFVWENYFIV